MHVDDVGLRKLSFDTICYLSGVILSDKEGSVPIRAVDFSRGARRGKEEQESSLPSCLCRDSHSITSSAAAGVGYC